MRWFKHLSQASEDEKIAEVLETFGPEGYGIYWLILEKIAFLMEKGSDKTSARYSLKQWGKFCGKSPKVFLKYLNYFAKLPLIYYKICEYNPDFYIIDCPNLLKYRDEYTKKSGQSPDEIPTYSGETPDQDRDTETDIDTELDLDLEEPPKKTGKKSSRKKGSGRVKKPKTDPPGPDPLEIQNFIDSISEATKNLCREKGIGQLKFKQFVETCFDHFRGKEEQKADWEATVRNWIRNDEKFGVKNKTNNKEMTVDEAFEQAKIKYGNRSKN